MWTYLDSGSISFAGLFTGIPNLSLLPSRFIGRGYTKHLPAPLTHRQRIEMATSVGATSKHPPADREYIGSLSPLTLIEFRNYMFSSAYITRNATKFLNYEWVNISDLREYMQQTTAGSVLGASTAYLSTVSDPVRVKIEPVSAPGPPDPVKAEPQAVILPQISDDIKMRTLNEGGREVFELLSDSEPEPDESDGNSDAEVMETLQRTSRSSSAVPLSDANDFPDNNSNIGAKASETLSDGDDSELLESDTVWASDDGTSRMRVGKFRLTQKITVKRIEYRQGPASIYPIHRVQTGIVVDLSEEKYHLRDPVKNELYSLNSVINNADNDSWEWVGGSRRAGAMVTFAPGEKAVPCRCIRYDCKGVHACDQLDNALRRVVRFELDDPAPRKAIIVAQQETRRREGNTPEERVVIFLKIIRNTKCDAVDSKGTKCRGGPVLKPKPQGPERDHQFFVGCSGWTTKFQKGHRTHTIPDQVDENLLANALAGLPLTDDGSKDTLPCSGIIHPHTGLKKKSCPHAHIVNGMPVQGQIVNYPCDAKRSIYIPKDTSIRKVLIIHNDTGHNHPMPALAKMSFAHKDTYRGCIEDFGVLGATVSKVDNAQSTKMKLNGKTPAAHALPLYNQRVKRDILHAEKLKKYPNGLGVEAIKIMYRAELTKPLPERYIHSCIETKKGEIIILTFVPYLLKLLDDPGVTSFDGDTTYKGIEGNVNEWELTIFAKVVQRAASILRAYINGASTDFYEELFDELQRVKLTVTGRPIPLKRFVRGGNLLVTNVDMDGAQALAICRSVMKYNEPEYSGIPNDTPPEEIASEFIKLCWRHGKEPIHDFKSLVSAEQHARIRDVFYIDSKESLEEFSTFLYGLGIQKISDWWRHKQIHPWIIPCLIKSQSHIPADVWDSTPSTTNTNEAQHHWTNNLTGIRLPPVEALESRRVADHNVAREIQTSLETGILSNSNNELSHRMSRTSTRQSTVARKARESREAADISKELQLQIDAEVEKRRISNELTKSLKEQLNAAKAPIRAEAMQSDHNISPADKDPGASAHETQSDVIPSAPMAPTTIQSLDKDPGASAHETQSDVIPSAPVAPTTVQSLGPSAPEFQPSAPSDSSFNSSNTYDFNNFDFDSLMRDLEGAMNTSSFAHDTATTDLFAYDPTFDSRVFADPNMLMPSSAPPGPADPLQDFLNSYGDYGGFFDAGAPVDSGLFTVRSYDELPLQLPPAPPDSPPALSPSVEHTSEPSAPRSRRARKEVDEANIIHTTRSRAPSARKRVADGKDISSRPLKKSKVWFSTKFLRLSGLNHSIYSDMQLEEGGQLALNYEICYLN
ncbi:hypothetical protein B0H11DRAFT_2356610 [Mycena galericulata]|nr:hypothetical protein B0H11DRAFT_2356610 [Mycena galericulata]